MQPKSLVTEKEYVSAGNPLKIVVNPVPVVVNPLGIVVIVQVPDAGNPDKATLPVDKAQVGCVIVPTIGAEIPEPLTTTLNEHVEELPA